MKILFDTNIIVDFIAKRQPFYNDSREIFYMAAKKEITGIVSASSITDIYYLAKKFFSDFDKSQKAVSDLLNILYAVDTKAQDIYSALKLGFSDFEDAVVCAVAVREKADFIVTRNAKDFVYSTVKAVSPSDFLQYYRNDIK
ncbi:MAG: PIN domain-containing protein [Chitinivibrionia bacterium]|nr:PIN domain-containing protein [Chitinivibrionia bacterium]